MKVTHQTYWNLSISEIQKTVQFPLKVGKWPFHIQKSRWSFKNGDPVFNKILLKREKKYYYPSSRVGPNSVDKM